jgi:hypothetical protein
VTEPRDAMDDMLDELLDGADRDLDDYLNKVVDVHTNFRSVARLRFDFVVSNHGPTPVFDVSVVYSVEPLIDLVARLVSRLSIGTTNLQALRGGLATRQLSRDAADELIAAIVVEVRDHDRLYAATCMDAKRALDALTSLRQAVARLFDDANDQSIQCPTR